MATKSGDKRDTGSAQSRTVFYLFITVLGLGVFAYKVLPTLLSDSYFPIDGRAQYIDTAHDTDTDITDFCLANMEIIAERMKKGGDPKDSTLRCPLHNRPYVITERHGRIIVSDPNPEEHVFSLMGVSLEGSEYVLEEKGRRG